MSRRARILAAALVAAVVVSGLGLAYAASMGVTGGAVSSVSAGHPCPGTASAVATNPQGGNNYRSVSLRLPPGCAGLHVSLNVDRPSNANRVGEGDADANGRLTIVLNNNYDVTANNVLLATVGGWTLPATWTPPIWCTVTDGSGATCTATLTVFTGVKPGGSSSATYYDVVVTTTSTSYVPWEVSFELDHRVYGGVPTRLGNSTLDAYSDGSTAWNGTTNNVTRQTTCATIPLFTVRGVNVDPSGTNNFTNVRNNRARRFSLVANRTEAGYFDLLSPGCT